MRRINYIAIHCSATKVSADIGAAEIRRWHVKDRGWRDIGYHYVIRRSGQVEPGRPLAEAGAHVSGYNSNSIGICLVGGIGADGRAENNFVPAQWEALKALVARLKRQHPKAVIQGHRDFPNVKKDCPCFDARAWAAKEGLG
ncbi:N-acetylmuramoyl-L-alanine amidase [Deltaproteobacteria bacterium OttesenSCG-928-M10]|nr:N-acetylmuramoyl-L-alanine amidase [Deltaproteobacteria bacterium OttesenSCG-928-M10]